jgi:hypothetical protein
VKKKMNQLSKLEVGSEEYLVVRIRLEEEILRYENE